MANGRRCDIGCETWPDEPIYSKCAVCGEPTKRYSDMEPLSAREARSIKLRHEFESYYEKRCAGMNIPADGPLPLDHEVPAA